MSEADSGGRGGIPIYLVNCLGIEGCFSLYTSIAHVHHKTQSRAPGPRHRHHHKGNTGPFAGSPILAHNHLHCTATTNSSSHPSSPTPTSFFSRILYPSISVTKLYLSFSMFFFVLASLQTAWKVGKDGIEAGTDLVPGSIPRPIARIGVAGVLLSFSLFVLKSFVSTAFFVLGVMGLIYFVYIAINKDEGPRGGGRSGGGDPDMSEDSALEEARRIMEKYK
ncbi:hypothetical protein ACHQM5_027820 [Ranunculus cassubicifolius]